MTARVAGRYSSRKPGTAACSVLMAMYLVRRSRKRAEKERQYPAVIVPLVMADPCDTCSDATAKDWAGNKRTFVTLWGLPSGAILAAGFLGPTPRTIIWAVMLLWMGGACVANARRCNRTHCRFTGPFLILMAVFVVAYAVGVLPLGRYGWDILAGTSFVGSALLWWGSERILGAFTVGRRSLPGPL